APVIKECEATEAAQPGWSLTSGVAVRATTPSAPTRWLRGIFLMSRPPLLTRRGLRSPVRLRLRRAKSLWFIPHASGKLRIWCPGRRSQFPMANKTLLIEASIAACRLPGWWLCKLVRVKCRIVLRSFDVNRHILGWTYACNSHEVGDLYAPDIAIIVIVILNRIIA